MNLIIHHPRKDQCDVCSQYEAGTLEQEVYGFHVNEKDRARLEKSDDKQRSLENEYIKVLTNQLVPCTVHRRYVGEPLGSVHQYQTVE